MHSNNYEQKQELSNHKKNSVDQNSLIQSSIQDTQENLNGNQSHFLPLSAAIKKNFKINDNKRRLMGINSRVEE